MYLWPKSCCCHHLSIFVLLVVRPCTHRWPAAAGALVVTWQPGVAVVVRSFKCWCVVVVVVVIFCSNHITWSSR